ALARSRLLYGKDPQGVLKAVQEAAAADPGNSEPPLGLSQWWTQTIRVQRPESDVQNPATAALGYARRAQKLDPDNTECYRSEYQLCRMLAERHKERARDYLGQAANALSAVVARDPTEAQLHYELADLNFRLNDAVGGRREAEHARELDALASVHTRELSKEQREQIQKCLGPSPTEKPLP